MDALFSDISWLYVINSSLEKLAQAKHLAIYLANVPKDNQSPCGLSSLTVPAMIILFYIQKQLFTLSIIIYIVIIIYILLIYLLMNSVGGRGGGRTTSS